MHSFGGVRIDGAQSRETRSPGGLRICSYTLVEPRGHPSAPLADICNAAASGVKSPVSSPAGRMDMPRYALYLRSSICTRVPTLLVVSCVPARGAG